MLIKNIISTILKKELKNETEEIINQTKPTPLEQQLDLINRYRSESKNIREHIKEDMKTNKDLSIEEQKSIASKKIKEAKLFVKTSGLDKSLLDIFLKINFNSKNLENIGATDIKKEPSTSKKITFTYIDEKISFYIGEKRISGMGYEDGSYDLTFKVLLGDKEVYHVTFNEECNYSNPYDDECKWTCYEPYLFKNGKWVDYIIEIDEKFKIYDANQSAEYKAKSDVESIKNANNFEL